MEWCADWYDDFAKWAVTDPAGPLTGMVRVKRGWCFKDLSQRRLDGQMGCIELGVWCRYIGNFSIYSQEGAETGFRVAMNISENPRQVIPEPLGADESIG